MFTFAKDSVGTKVNETKFLGMLWYKEQDTIAVNFRWSEELSTKQISLCTIAKVFDPLGIASPVMLAEKNPFCDICDKKIAWDSIILIDLRKRWKKWLKNLPQIKAVTSCSTQNIDQQETIVKTLKKTMQILK